MSSKTCVRSFYKFVDVNKSVSTTKDQKTSLDGPSSKHMGASIASEEKEKMEEMHLLMVCPACTGSLMALSVLGSTDASMRIVNAVDEVKDFILVVPRML
jgi:hypothetical protein